MDPHYGFNNVRFDLATAPSLTVCGGNASFFIFSRLFNGFLEEGKSHALSNSCDNAPLFHVFTVLQSKYFL